jgi:hypothetical protein
LSLREDDHGESRVECVNCIGASDIPGSGQGKRKTNAIPMEETLSLQRTRRNRSG